MPKNKELEIINIGDELLLGVRENDHLNYLGCFFADNGIPVSKCTVIRDNPDEIKASFQKAWGSSDIVIITGGLGVTSRGNVKQVIADCLGKDLVLNNHTKEIIESKPGYADSPLDGIELQQCFIIEGSTTISNDVGTSPGIFLQVANKSLLLLPGLYQEIEPMFEEKIIPLIKEHSLLTAREPFLQLRTIGKDELALTRLLSPEFKKNEGIKVKYLSHKGLIDIRLSPKNETVNQEDLLKTGEICREILGEDFVCYEDVTLAELITSRLRSVGKTISIAESCTGGSLSSEFTDIPGSSEVFTGGIVTYSNDAKIQLLDIPESVLLQHDAVSAETAIAMATGVAEKFSSDFGLSVTGFAGPSGGTEENPVGTIYMGFHSPKGEWSQKINIQGSRISVKARAVNCTLDWVRRIMDHYRFADVLDVLDDE